MGRLSFLDIWVPRYRVTLVTQAPSSGGAPGSHWDLDGSRVPVDLLAAARPGRGAARSGAVPFVAGAQGVRLRGRGPRSSRRSRTRPACRDRTASARWLPLGAVSAD